MKNERVMKESEMLSALVRDYISAHRVYESYEKEAKMFIEKGDMAAYKRATDRAVCRSNILTGIKRAAVTLGIDERDFMMEVVRKK